MKRLVLAVLILWPLVAWASPARVNGGDAFSGTSTATPSFAYGSSLTAGNTVVGCIMFVSGGGQTLTGVSDGTNTYTVVGQSLTSNALSGALFYKENIAAVTTPTITFTLTGGASNANIMMADQFSGVSTSAATDGAIEGIPGPVSGANSFTSGNLSPTPTHNGDLIYGCAGVNGSATLTNGAGFTSGTADNTNQIYTEWQVQTTAAAIASTFTPSASDSGWVNGLALQAAGGGGGGCTLLTRGRMGVGC